MKEITIKKCFLTACSILAYKFKRLDALFLKINDRHNWRLKRKMQNSFEIRAALYSEGGVRLSNDPDIHLYYRWPLTGNTIWAEVPCFNIHALLQFPERIVLELGCANGWYYREFYSGIDKLKYIGCDLAEDTINEAEKKLIKKEKSIKKKFDANFLVADICKNMPMKGEQLTNIFWFASMCMFTREQREGIFFQITERLKEKKGILSGSAVLKDINSKQWNYYIGLFENEDDLRDELGCYFNNVFITKTSEKNLIFYMASDGKLPFTNE